MKMNGIPNIVFFISSLFKSLNCSQQLYVSTVRIKLAALRLICLRNASSERGVQPVLVYKNMLKHCTSLFVIANKY